MHLPADAVRVVVPDAGGAFGATSPIFPEYLAVAHAARLLGVPVRWVEDQGILLAGPDELVTALLLPRLPDSVRVLEGVT